MEIFIWLKGWFSGNCNGEWEYENQIEIFTASNPGWFIKIGIRGTTLENMLIDNDTVETDKNDWYFWGVKEGVFKAAGDLSKLSFLLEKFKELIETDRSVV